MSFNIFYGFSRSVSPYKFETFFYKNNEPDAIVKGTKLITITRLI